MVDVWSGIVGNRSAIDHLRKQAASGEISHAYLFTGAMGVGKALTARALAAALNCGSGGCGVCPSCSMALQGRHPGVLLVEPEGGKIPVETVRDLRRTLALKNPAGAYRVCIIDGVDAMPVVAANAFLKTLEEPPPGTVIVGISSRQDMLLDTIVSRCQMVRFTRAGIEDTSGLLERSLGLEPERARLLARVSGGAPGVAVGLAGMPERLEVRGFALKFLHALPDGDVGRLHSLAGRFAGLVAALGEVLVAKQAQEMEELATVMAGDKYWSKTEKEMKLRQKRQLHHFLQRCYDDLFKYMAVIYRDTVLVDSGAGTGLLVNADLADELPLALMQEGLRWNEPLTHAVEVARARLHANVSPLLCLEALLFSLAEVVQSSAASC